MFEQVQHKTLAKTNLAIVNQFCDLHVYDTQVGLFKDIMILPCVFETLVIKLGMIHWFIYTCMASNAPVVEC